MYFAQTYKENKKEREREKQRYYIHIKYLTLFFLHTCYGFDFEELINIYYNALKSDYYYVPSQSSSLPKIATTYKNNQRHNRHDNDDYVNDNDYDVDEVAAHTHIYLKKVKVK